jgi:hypothetical protein
MKVKFTPLILVLFIAAPISVFSQSNNLPVTKNYLKAIKNETRTINGLPGKKYWTNFSNYKMEVEIIPQTKTLMGSAIVTYYNNSPDTLKELNFKLIQNVHVPTASRNDVVDMGFFTKGMQLDTFKINNEQVEWNNEEVNASDNPTNNLVALKNPLLPAASLTINMVWHYEINQSIADAREGLLDTTSFFIAYWYPRISVYDDVEGWDKIPHNGSAEFYNGFGNYDITVKVPQDYIVIATGDLLNPNEVYTEPVANRLDEANNNDDVNLCILLNDIKNKTIKLADAAAWHFKADSVCDFAFGISNHYLLDAASVMVDSVSKRRISIQVAYDTAATNYEDVCEWSQKAVKFLSFDLPGYTYPYNKLSVFQGHTFMEYPMMVNDHDDADDLDAQSTTLHEIAHTYFPFLMGINETRYSFMDEGWAAFLELMGNTRCYGQKDGEQLWANYYCRNARGAINTPLMVKSYELTDDYGFNSYGKPALGYYTLFNFIGEAKFKKCIKQYINIWKNKHPIPYDFFNVFNAESKTDLNWFWNNWFYEFNYFDLAVKGVKATGNTYTITIENHGGKAIPVTVEVLYADGTTSTITQKCDVWKSKKVSAITTSSVKKIKQVKLLNGIYPDADSTNNLYEVK